MTCIAGLVHEGKVYLGADSAMTGGWMLNQTILTDGKVFSNSRMLIGVCGYVRTLQLLHYSLVPPAHHSDVDVYNYLVTSFMEAVRDTLKRGGVSSRKDEVESFDSEFLLGYKGRLFNVQEDYSVTESADGYTAIGSGQDLALGSLFTSATQEYLGPRERITLALEAAERFNAGVRRPFHIEALESEAKA